MVSNNKKKNKKKNKAKHANQHTEKEETKSDDEFQHQVQKRGHTEDYSDAEGAPKRKKKKKQPVPVDSSDKKGQKSIRQMKREKHAQRMAEEAAAAKDQLKGQCISYLSQWKHDKPNWKFMKAKQVWLYKNKFNSYLLPDSSWPVFLEYFESAQGNIRNLLLEDAKKVIKQMDEWTESQNNTEENTAVVEDTGGDKSESPKKPDDTAYKRARDLIQCLEE